MAAHKFEACLTGDQVTTGKFRARLTKHALEYRLLIRNITGLTEAQLHLGDSHSIDLYESAGPSGALKVALIGGDLTSKQLQGCTFRQLVKELMLGNVHVKVQTNHGTILAGRVTTYTSLKEEESWDEPREQKDPREKKNTWDEPREQKDPREKKKDPWGQYNKKKRDPWEEDESHKKDYPYPWELDTSSSFEEEVKRSPWEAKGWPWDKQSGLSSSEE